MDLGIKASESILSGEHRISIPEEIRRDLGIVPGQRISFSAGGKEILLEVSTEILEGQKDSLVSGAVYSALVGKASSYTIPTITLGCDPEFFILLGRQKISAATYLPYNGQVGCDGDLGELRPMYGTHESQVAKNICDLIKTIPGKMKRADWAIGLPDTGKDMSFVAHSYLNGTAAGFHIHLGLPPQILNTRVDISRPVLNYIVKALDWYLSCPLVLLETENQRRCGKSNYGKPGDYRTTKMTLEYRTPGGFYLRNKILTEGMLGLGLLITEHVVASIQEMSGGFKRLGDLKADALKSILPLPHPTLVHRTLQETSKDLAQRAYPGIRKALEALPNFSNHSAAAEDFFRVVDGGTAPGPNLITNWVRKNDAGIAATEQA